MQADDEILDVSAGTGLLAEELLNLHGPFKKLVLNDPSPGMLERAKYRLRYQKEHTEFTNYYSENLSFEENTFSQIICLNSFHYYVDQPAVLAHFARLLKPGGSLWLQDWNRTGLFVIANKLIDLLSPENINTRTLSETKTLCKQSDLIPKEDEEWRFRYWNFFFLRCKTWK